MEDRPDLKGEHIMKGWNELCLIQRPNVLYALLSFKFCQGETTWDDGQSEERTENRPSGCLLGSRAGDNWIGTMG